MAYVLGKVVKLNQFMIERHFPNLNGNNFRHTSDFTDDYNCVAWATEIEDDWVQFPPYNTEDDYSDSVNSYIDYFTKLGFELTKDIRLEKGVAKIAIYTNEVNEFKHVARQLADGRWASKIGNWEDIEHTTLDAIAGGSYGNHNIYMQRIV